LHTLNGSLRDFDPMNDCIAAAVPEVTNARLDSGGRITHLVGLRVWRQFKPLWKLLEEIATIAHSHRLATIHFLAIDIMTVFMLMFLTLRIHPTTKD